MSKGAKEILKMIFLSLIKRAKLRDDLTRGCNAYNLIIFLFFQKFSRFTIKYRDYADFQGFYESFGRFKLSRG